MPSWLGRRLRRRRGHRRPRGRGRPARQTARAADDERLARATGTGRRRSGRWVRITRSTPRCVRGPRAVMPAGPTGSWFPGRRTAAARSARRHAPRDRARVGMAPGTTRICRWSARRRPPRSASPLMPARNLPRLAGLTWVPRGLFSHAWRQPQRDAAGVWTDTFRLVRAQCCWPPMRAA